MATAGVVQNNAEVTKGVSGFAGKYQYGDQLKELDKPPVPGTRPSIQTKGCILTPLRLEAWQQELALHPDRWFADYICRGIQQGFRVGFQETGPT